MTTTKVTDLRSAVQAIREAAIPDDNWPRETTVEFTSSSSLGDRITVDGLCRDVYSERGFIGDAIYVGHIKDDRAYAIFKVGPARPWVEAVEDVVDWLATESPVPA